MAAIPTNKKMARKPTEEPISEEAAAGASAPKQPAKGLNQNVSKESMGTNAGVSQQLKRTYTEDKNSTFATVRARIGGCP